jgi:hypothetical protein
LGAHREEGASWQVGGCFLSREGCSLHLAASEAY